jgi:hypothetical protein
VVVDLAKVRLAGGVRGDTLRPAARAAAWPALDPDARRRAASLDRALALLPRDAHAAADTLALLRVRALGEAPALAAALGDALDALQAGRDATPALVRARRAALAGDATARAGATAAGAWGASLPALGARAVGGAP